MSILQNVIFSSSLGLLSSKSPTDGDALRQPVDRVGLPSGVVQGAQTIPQLPVHDWRKADAAAGGQETAEGGWEDAARVHLGTGKYTYAVCFLEIKATEVMFLSCHFYFRRYRNWGLQRNTVYYITHIAY